ncbi:DUF4179 domain-containing protein [Bacillus spongiae]|uniref:DUF4179 domain-containing protein n=1 Tax=Bacillus spongiae TaxID=2683610 RepID=A0ABU8HJT5_9BACI
MDKEKLKNAVDQIDIPTEKVLAAIDKGISEGSKLKQKKTSPKRKLIISSLVAASLFGVTIASGFVNPSMNRVLANTPLIGTLFEKFGNQTGVRLAEQGLVTELNQTLTKKGVSVTIYGAYFDGMTIGITGHVSGDIDMQYEEDEVSFDVNFEEYEGDHDPWLGLSYGYEKVDNGFDFGWTLEYPYENIEDDFTVPLTIHYVNGVRGEWKFDIPIKQIQESVTLNHTETYKEEEIQIRINKLNTSSETDNLEYEIISKHGDDVSFADSGVSKSLSQSRSEEGYYTIYRTEFPNIENDVEFLTMYPILKINEPPVEKRLTESSFLLEGERTPYSVKVNDIKEENNQVIMDYQIIGFEKKISEDEFERLTNNLVSYDIFQLIHHDYLNVFNPANPNPDYYIYSNTVTVVDKASLQFQSIFQLDDKETFENFSLEKAVLRTNLFDHLVEEKELEPFTVQIPNEGR